MALNNNRKRKHEQGDENDPTDENGTPKKIGPHEPLDSHIARYEIKIMNPPRRDKKLLVLDLDYTLSDFNVRYERKLARPYLYSFLASAYRNYDIAIWSATKMSTLKIKLNILGLLNDPNFRILFCLDRDAMAFIYHEPEGYVRTKPLELIWKKFPCYTMENTIIIDDCQKNILNNPDNGIIIEPYHRKEMQSTDKVLLGMTKYLAYLSTVDYVSFCYHEMWKVYVSSYEATISCHNQ